MTLTGWQTIESAPKDGRSVLLVLDGKVVVGRWLDSVTYRYGKESSRIAEWIIGDRYTSAQWDNPNPSHWMPFPAAPELVANASEGEGP